MKATVTRKELSDALAIAGAASSNRSSLPALMSIKLEAGSSGLTLTGCDGEMWATATLHANVAEPGSVCVQARLLADIVGALPEVQVTLELAGTSVYLRAQQSEWMMLAMPAEEFPPIPEVKASSELTLPADSLRNAIDGVAFAVSEDTSRPVLTGVQFKYDGETLTLVATDTHRLAVTRVHKTGLGSSIEAVVPDKALSAIRALPVVGEDPLTIGFDETRLVVDIGTAKIVSQVLSGTYPNWERVVPSEYTRTWTLNKKEFHDNVKRIMILAKDNANRVRFAGSGDRIVISARSEDKGEAKEEVEVIGKNGDLEIAFNGRYVMDALAAMEGDGIRAEMTEASRPAVLRPAEHGEDHFCVVMPMAIG
ncbi:MAG: DNA polymerase III subunit beta [Fimbriimonadaceae bacterium]|nr:DNA polymerase III subunit beta [Fimbriimonadaceae bacterium]